MFVLVLLGLRDRAPLIEELARAGTLVEFVKGPRGDSPEDQLLVRFQGMFAECEKAQILERYRRGKAHRARTGSVNVLSGAPFGYRYVRKSDHAGAGYEIVEHEAAPAGSAPTNPSAPTTAVWRSWRSTRPTPPGGPPSTG